MRNAGILVLILLVTACGGERTPTIPPPDGAPAGSLLVLETRPCNWLQQPDPNACDPVGLVRIGLDGEVQEELTPGQPMAMYSMALSHDRQQIAWTWNWEVAAMGVDGSDARVVNTKLLAENMGETALDPVWSPDGTELLYSWSGATGEDAWYRVHVETGAMTKVKLPVDCAGMSWALDGSRLACEVWLELEADAGRSTSLSDLYLVDLDTMEATELTDPDDAIGNGRPEWSPDGRWLTFARWTDAADQAADMNGAWVVDVATGDAIRVAPGRISVPVWSPDGGHFAAYVQDEGKVIIVGRDGSGLTVLDHEPRRFTAPRWLPED